MTFFCSQYILTCASSTVWKGKKMTIFLPNYRYCFFGFHFSFIRLPLQMGRFCPGLILRQKSVYFTTRQLTPKNQFSVMTRQAHIQGTRAQVLGSPTLDQGSLWSSETKTGPQVPGMREETWKPDRLLRNERDRENYFPCGTQSQ